VSNPRIDDEVTELMQRLVPPTPTKMDVRGARVGLWIVGCGTLALASSAVGVLGWQGISWLKHGYWTTISLGDALAYLGGAPNVFGGQTEWVGVAKIIEFFKRIEISIYLLLVMFLSIRGFETTSTEYSSLKWRYEQAEKKKSETVQG
jgi:hypothetical protein